MVSQPSLPAKNSAEQFSILDPAMLLRIEERAMRWKAAQAKLTRVPAAVSLSHALACIAATVDLGPSDAIVAQRYSVEAEIARGADLSRVVAACARSNLRKARAMDSAAVLGLATGLASSAATRVGPATQKERNVVLALLETALQDSTRSILSMARQRKLPIVIVALQGGLPAPPADTAAAYEIERFPRIPVDRDDPIGIYRVAHEAVQRARIGYGPTLVDCVAWPLAQPRDPLSKLKSHIPGRPQSRQKVLEHQLSAELKSGTDAPEPAVALFAAQ